MPCFPTVGLAAPSIIPFIVKALSALPTPRQDIIRRRGGAPQPPTVSQPIPGQDRDEAGAKCLTRRVLHFANGAPAVYQDDGSAFHFMLGFKKHQSRNSKSIVGVVNGQQELDS